MAAERISGGIEEMIREFLNSITGAQVRFLMLQAISYGITPPSQSTLTGLARRC
jgi:hypothetical protein